MAVELSAVVVEVQDDYEAIYEEYVQRGWTDGLPIVPPTGERIERMLGATDLASDHVLGELPPRRSEVTVEKAAINAVMAGCRPAYFPVLIAMLEGILEPAYNIYGIDTTTNPVTTCTIVNGPLRQELDINGSYGYLGPGWRANATIGRALKLIERNVGGTIPGEVSKATAGQPGRYTLLFGELEERSPWPPFHTTRGFQAGDNTVTVFAATSTLSFIDTQSKTAEALLYTVAHSIDTMGTNTLHGGGDRVTDSLVVLCPDHANLLAIEGGLSRQQVQQFLLENARRPITDWHAQYHDQLRDRGLFKNGYVHMHERPEQFLIAVAGGGGGYHSVYLPGFGGLSQTITKPIRKKGTQEAPNP